MNSSLKLILAGAILVSGVGFSSAQAKTLDVIHDSNGKPVLVKSGDCLRSNWENPNNACNKAAPAPKEEPAPVAKVSRDTTSVFFAFGESKLSPEGEKALDALVADLKAKGTVVGIRVAGFADRIGNAAANEKLSKKRADKVRRYLLAKGIVNAEVVETRWFGDSVAAAKCDKKMDKKAMIQCLQPDRRVDIEIDYTAPTK